MQQKPIAIIGAMNEEIELILQDMKSYSKNEIAGNIFYQGLIKNKSLVVCKTGVGKVNAAIVTQILIDYFHVSHLIFTGVAGALAPQLNIGDIVISTECMYHDMDVTALGFALGEIPYQSTSIFKADPSLVEAAYSSGQMLFPGRILKGRVLSGDQFITDRQKVVKLHKELLGLCTEMEGAAVAQVCFMNHVPYVVIRSMSDKADGAAHSNFSEFTKQASLHSYQIVIELIKSIAK